MKTAPEEDDLIHLWDEKHEAAGCPLFRDSSSQCLAAPPQRTWRLLGRTLADARDILLGRVAFARRGLVLALSAAVLNQFCASTSILIYAQHMLSTVGVGSQVGLLRGLSETIVPKSRAKLSPIQEGGQSLGIWRQVEQDAQAMLLIFAKLVGVSLGLLLVERVSRRQLLGGGGACCAVALAVLTLGAYLSSNWLLMSGMGCFVLFFFSTWGVGYWAVVVEVTVVGGPRYASAAQAMSTATLFAAGWLTSLTFLKAGRAALGGVFSRGDVPGGARAAALRGRGGAHGALRLLLAAGDEWPLAGAVRAGHFGRGGE